MDELGVKELETLSSALVEKVRGLRASYPEDRFKSSLLPALHMAQAEKGWLSVGTMDEVASLLSVAPIEVYEVASFYSMFHLKPVGKYVLEVCQTSPCQLAGSDQIIAHLESRLNVKVGQTTVDGRFTLKTVECLASCGTAPVLQFGPAYNYHENLTVEKVDQLIDTLTQSNSDES